MCRENFTILTALQQILEMDLKKKLHTYLSCHGFIILDKLIATPLLPHKMQEMKVSSPIMHFLGLNIVLGKGKGSGEGEGVGEGWGRGVGRGVGEGSGGRGVGKGGGLY